MINLCEGDMRKVVNMIQSVHISLKANSEESVQPVVDRDFIYKMSGYPHPADIDEIFQILLNDTCKSAFTKIKQLKAVKGISLVSIIKEVSLAIFFIILRVLDIQSNHIKFEDWEAFLEVLVLPLSLPYTIHEALPLHYGYSVHNYISY